MRPGGTEKKRARRKCAALTYGRAVAACGRRGQVLLIAVLLMMVVLLVGILFVALVTRNQQQSARHVDVVSADALAEAGIRYVDRMLQTSPLGADWRPHFQPYVLPSAADPYYPSYDEDDPATWPSPPAMYRDTDGTISWDPNFYGPDGIAGSEDDYYSDFDITRGWCPLRKGSVDAPGEFIRFGYHRYPDPNPGGDTGVAIDASTLGKGYVLVRVIYDPDPPYERNDGDAECERDDRYDANDISDQANLSMCIKIEAIGRVSDESTVFRRLVAYKPIGLTDHLRWITDGSKSGKRGFLGLRALTDFDASGSATNNANVNEALDIRFGGPVRANTALHVLGDPVEIDHSAGTTGSSTYFDLQAVRSPDGYLRDDALQATGGIYAWDEDVVSGYYNPGVSARLTVGSGVTQEHELPRYMPPEMTTTDADAANPGDPMNMDPRRVATGNRDVPPLEAPDITATDPTTGMDRYRVLSRDSGIFVRNGASGVAANTGRYGHGEGCYIDNHGDIQFQRADGTCDMSLLVRDWRKDPRDIGVLTGDSGWNAPGTTYTPPAVEIEFFPSEEAVLSTCTTQTSSGTAPTDPGVLWWPNHTAGEPGIKITRHDRRWLLGDHTVPNSVGNDSGENIMVIDYPEYPNQVIFAEGNVRVKGVLPAAARGGPSGTLLLRDYNTTVVSNATIYIDGQILSPQDVSGRRVDIVAGGGVLDEDNTAVALLARDFVCLNPTQLVPQLTSGLVPAAADDEMAADSEVHWELDSDTGGRVYSWWMSGETVPANVQSYLTVQQTSGSPGPSGVGLVLDHISPAGAPPPAYEHNISPYSFGNPVDPFTFIFAPEGALLWGSVAVPNAYTSTAIAPQWEASANVGPFAVSSVPTVPWRITGNGGGMNVSKTVATRNAVALTHRDPQLGTAATECWVRKWKIEEINTDISRPRGAINAKVNALIYAQRGSWFVIPGAYFDENTYTADFDGDGDVDADDSLWAARMRRYNYRITVRGCITEDHTAEVDDLHDWSNKWAFPIYDADTMALSWGTIDYEFDERLRIVRDQGLTSLDDTPTRRLRVTSSRLHTPQANLPKLPLLPVSPTLLYYGEAL
jgi:hypothetical protein